MLPSPPILERVLFEAPFPAMGGVALAGAVAFIILNRTGKARVGLLAAGAAVALAGLIYLVSVLVTTEREVLAQRTRALIAAAATANTGDLATLLDARVDFILAGGSVDRTRVIDLVAENINRRVTITSYDIGAVTASIDGENVARTQVRVWIRSDAALYDAPTGSTWRLDWRRDLPPPGATTPHGPWLVSAITPMQIDGVGDASKLRP